MEKMREDDSQRRRMRKMRMRITQMRKRMMMLITRAVVVGVVADSLSVSVLTGGMDRQDWRGS